MRFEILCARLVQVRSQLLRCLKLHGVRIFFTLAEQIIQRAFPLAYRTLSFFRQSSQIDSNLMFCEFEVINC